MNEKIIKKLNDTQLELLKYKQYVQKDEQEFFDSMNIMIMTLVSTIQLNEQLSTKQKQEIIQCYESIEPLIKELKTRQ